MKLKRLLVYVLTIISDYAISVELALLLINTWVSSIIASTRDGDPTKSSPYCQLLLMATVPTLNDDLRGSNRSPACIGDDARDNNELTNEVAL